MSESRTISGQILIKAQNHTGIRVNGDWYNLSKELQPKFDSFNIGDHVDMEVVGTNLIVKITESGSKSMEAVKKPEFNPYNPKKDQYFDRKEKSIILGQALNLAASEKPDSEKTLEDRTKYYYNLYIRLHKELIQ